MSIERKSADRILGFRTREEAERYCDQDLLIRSGMCPNGHGLMKAEDGGQSCGTCNFFCNTPSELVSN